MTHTCARSWQRRTGVPPLLERLLAPALGLEDVLGRRQLVQRTTQRTSGSTDLVGFDRLFVAHTFRVRLARSPGGAGHACTLPTARSAGLGDLRPAHRQLEPRPLLLLVVGGTVIRAGSAIGAARSGVRSWQPDWQRVARRHRLGATHHDNAGEHRLKYGGLRGIGRCRAGENATHEPPRPVEADEPQHLLDHLPRLHLRANNGVQLDRRNGRCRSVGAPPSVRTESAISARTSSQMPPFRGAANASICKEFGPCTIVVAIGCCSSFISMRTSVPGNTGTSNPPRSSRGSASPSPASASSSGRSASGTSASVADNSSASSTVSSGCSVVGSVDFDCRPRRNAITFLRSPAQPTVRAGRTPRATPVGHAR